MTAVTASLITYPETRFESDHPFTLHIGTNGRQSIRMSPGEAWDLLRDLQAEFEKWKLMPERPPPG